jgi:hypothetical protein
MLFADWRAGQGTLQSVDSVRVEGIQFHGFPMIDLDRRNRPGYSARSEGGEESGSRGAAAGSLANCYVCLQNRRLPMRSCSLWNRGPAGNRFATAGVIAALLTAFVLPARLDAQASKKKIELQSITGKVTTIEKKGKITEWTVEVEAGDPIEVTFTAKTPQLEVTGKADSGFLRPGTVISAVANKQGNNLTFKDYTVHLGITPGPRMVRDRNSPVESYEICAQIIAVDGDNLLLNVGASRQPARLDQAAEASIQSTDPTTVPEGSPVTLEGLTRSGKFVPNKVTVSLEKPLSGEEYFAALNAPKTKASSKSKDDSPKSAKSKSSKTKDEPAAGGGGLEASDPFGLKKKATPKSEPKEEKKAGDK